MKRAIAFVVAFAGVLVAASAGADTYAIEEGTGYFWNGHNGGRAMSRDANGRLWCAYLHYQTPGIGQIRVAYSDDGGAHWTSNYLTGPDGPLYGAWPPAGTQENPALLVDGAGLLHVIWSSYTATTDTGGVHHAIHWPGTWDISRFTQREAADYAIDPLDGGGTPAAALDSQDRIHAVWSQKIGDASTKKNVYYAVYSGGQYGSWSEPRQLNPAPQRDQLSPSISVDDSDNVFVSYYAVDNGVGDVELLSGENLEIIEAVSDSAYSQTAPCITCDLDGNLHAVWLGVDEGPGHAYNVYYRRRDEDGEWHDVERVNNATSSDHRPPSVATDMNGAVYVVSEAWMPSESGYGVVRHVKSINDVAWSNSEALVMMGGTWAVKEPRMLHSVWPMIGRIPLNYPKNLYSFFFDVYALDPISGDAGDFSVRAELPENLTWIGQNYAALRVLPPATGGSTYAPGERINVEWRVYPDKFANLKTPHNVYFGVWKDASMDGCSATIQEVMGAGRTYLYSGKRRGWVNYSPQHFAWGNVTFPIRGSGTFGTLHFTVPGGAQGRWAFVMAVVDPNDGSFIASPEVACSQYFRVE